MRWQVDRADRVPLGEQIAASVRRAVSSGELAAGERIPPARELAEVLGVNANTVLAAYRVLRDEGIVEFRRGRGVQVSEAATSRGAVLEAARAYLDQGRRHGWGVDELAGLLRELS
jgi:GntR family transcriptional regulator